MSEQQAWMVVAPGWDGEDSRQ